MYIYICYSFSFLYPARKMYEYVVKHGIGLNTPIRRRLFVNFVHSFVDRFAVLIPTWLLSSLEEEKVFESFIARLKLRIEIFCGEKRKEKRDFVAYISLRLYLHAAESRIERHIWKSIQFQNKKKKRKKNTIVEIHDNAGRTLLTLIIEWNRTRRSKCWLEDEAEGWK